ncbi:MAG: hypothetical protein HC913_23445 [Microscillaceae bacterium]|nr:hypothetical protein [Microscillaceae bacterium]
MNSQVNNTEPITLIIQKDKKQAFLEMLKTMDFVEIETLSNKMERYIQNAPQDIPLTDEEIDALVKEVRTEKK